MVILSKSSLNTFLTCPRLYKFIYIDKVSVFVTSPAAQRGIDVHQFCEEFYDHVQIIDNQRVVDEEWLKEQLLIATDEARPYIENFIEFEKKHWNICVENRPEDPGKYYMPVLREKKITNLGLSMRGIIDRVDLNFDGKTYTAIDYKTEAYSTKSWKRTEHRREMCFYKKLLETSGLLGGPVTHFCIYYPRSNDVWNEKFSKRSISALDRCQIKVRARILAEDFPVSLGIFCRYCDCNRICSFE